MGNRVFATVKPEILKWARTSAGFSIEDAAAALKVDPDLLAVWEASEEKRPSLPQLRKMAIKYKRPLAVFYLQEVPLRFQVLSDLRRPVPGEDRPYSHALTYEIRSAQQRRELALELRSELDEPVEPLLFRLGGETPEQAGEAIRSFLQIDPDQIRTFGGDATGRLGFRTWRLALERSGVLVFQSSRISSSEASGFALAYDTMPVVVINRKDVPQRRLFSMLHEFAHVALRESGVSDLKIDGVQVQVPDIELRCNAIAAAALMPRETVLAELAAVAGDRAELTDEIIARVARRFGVSRPALLIRLIETSQVSWDFYFEKVAQYTAENERQRAARAPAKEMRRNMAQESLSDLGRPFVSLVLGNYYQRKLTLSDVAGYLGIRVKHVEALERRLAG
jgi:Zn-dependent peptidase ImmA (M78 family)/transcriptional regulator with XRE-family HTH domain